MVSGQIPVLDLSVQSNLDAISAQAGATSGILVVDTRAGGYALKLITPSKVILDMKVVIAEVQHPVVGIAE